MCQWKDWGDGYLELLLSDHEHAAPLGVVECSLHHEKLHCLRWVTRQELDQRLPERAASLVRDKIMRKLKEHKQRKQPEDEGMRITSQ